MLHVLANVSTCLEVNSRWRLKSSIGGFRPTMLAWRFWRNGATRTERHVPRVAGGRGSTGSPVVLRTRASSAVATCTRPRARSSTSRARAWGCGSARSSLYVRAATRSPPAPSNASSVSATRRLFGCTGRSGPCSGRIPIRWQAATLSGRLSAPGRRLDGPRERIERWGARASIAW